MSKRIPIDELSAGVQDVTPRDIEWLEAAGENLDGWSFWDTFEKEVNGKTVVLVSRDGSEASHVFDSKGRRIDLDDSDEVEQYLEDYGDDPEALTQDDLDDLEREPHGYVEGPMMNYWYPTGDSAPWRDDASIGGYQHATDEVGTAYRLHHLPLCLVMVDNEFGLALTGGGMDLTWEIAEAFTALGYLPPVHFCDLPAMAGRGPHNVQREGWTVEGDGERYEVRDASGEVVGVHTYWRAARKQADERKPASELDQYVIDAVTASLTDWRDRMTRRLQRHIEQFAPPSTAVDGTTETTEENA